MILAPAHLLFKFDAFFISKGVFPIPYTIAYTVVRGVFQFNPHNKDENNNSIISIISTTLATGTVGLNLCFFIFN